MNEKRVIFLDRDGVLCKEKGYVTSIEGLEIFDYSKKAIKILHELCYNVVVITNQSAVARGLVNEQTLIEMNNYLKQEVGVDEVFYCPHLPPKEGEKELLPYIFDCQCRKPKIGLVDRAIRELKLDLEGSYFVGDRASDIQTGQTIGATTVLLESGYGSKRLEANVKPDFIFNDLLEFAKYMIEKHTERV